MSGRILVAAGFVLGAASYAAAEEKTPEFLQVSLQEVVDMEVTSVSRKEEKASEAAAAIYVITREDLRRYGAANLVEALRLAPGVHVARAGSSQWAVSARGFNDQFANKLLVLIDGRTIYSPTFSGVFWDLHNPIIDDIERIEVIRGPGATVWGANAVNGVINIITRSAEDTQGTLINLGAGNQTPLNAQVRQGFALSETGFMRVYAAREEHDEARRTGGELGNNDAWQLNRAGFRADWEGPRRHNVTLQGELYQGEADFRYRVPSFSSPSSRLLFDEQAVYGAHLLGRWEKEYSARSRLRVQSFLDYNRRDVFAIDLEELTYDIDLQHIYDINDRTNLTWGLAYRYLDDDHKGTELLDFVPASRERQLYSGFVQFKLGLVPDEVFLTFGSKFEENDFSGFERQPSVRLSWLVDPHQTVWASFSHAVRTPDRANQDIVNPLATVPGAGSATVLVRRGQKENEAERLNSHEIGYRIQPSDSLAFDVSLFYNDYENLIINSVGAPQPASVNGQSFIEVPVTQISGGEGRSYGGEAVANWRVNNDWSLEFTYSYLDIDLTNGSSSVNTEFKSPQHMAGIHSTLNLPHDIEFDQYLEYVDSIETGERNPIADYLRLDLRVGWKPMENVRLSLSGQNLLDSYHTEFGPFLYNEQAEIGRSVYGQVSIQF